MGFFVVVQLLLPNNFVLRAITLVKFGRFLELVRGRAGRGVDGSEARPGPQSRAACKPCPGNLLRWLCNQESRLAGMASAVCCKIKTYRGLYTMFSGMVSAPATGWAGEEGNCLSWSVYSMR